MSEVLKSAKAKIVSSVIEMEQRPFFFFFSVGKTQQSKNMDMLKHGEIYVRSWAPGHLAFIAGYKAVACSGC